MYTLFSGLYAHLTQKEEYNVIILGLDNAGKTTLLEQIKQIYLGIRGLPPEKITPTVGMNIGKVEVHRSRINFWDLGGQDALRVLWDKYYDECHGIVFVIDSADSMRLDQCRETFEQMVMNDSVEGVPVVMLANKQDTDQAMRVEDIKEVFNRIALQLGARDSRVLPISALKGEGVEDAIEWLVLRMHRNKEDRPPVFRQ
ncbi:ADP-ribosylation factor family-domain-containing protein [Syncephalis plumigaleata]|nr:ADP-ribosylation factor family-domain-containing protein [Syncephalis plumigaleata]